jgi:long-chain acyl-CoA synthetase
MSGNFSNLVDLCQRSCAQYASNKLFGTKEDGRWQWITYADFIKLVDNFRAGLAELGVEAGNNIGIISNNRVEWAVACYATYGLKASFVPMYEAQLDKEWAFILNDCAATVAIAATNDIAKKLEALKPDVPSLKHVIGFELPADDERSYKAMLKNGAANPVEAKHPEESDTAGFIYTSGTTGNPKGVILSHGNITSNINAIHTIFTFEAADRSLSFLPWAHSFGQTCELHGLLSMGCSMGINDEVPSLVGNLAEVQPTILFAVPRIFNRIYDGVNKQMAEKPGLIQKLFRSGIANATKRSNGQSLGPLSSLGLKIADKIIFSKIRQKFGGQLKYAISGSAALNTEVAKFIDALGIMVYEGYGLTETSPIATANYPGTRKIGSVGKPIPDVTITIDCEVTGDPVQGEIIIAGPNIMQGYHNRPEENDKVLLPDRSFRSGDMGRVDNDGFLFITGRIKEQYKLENGKYVVPSPLEEELKLSPYVANAMIYGMNRPYNVALVVLDPDSMEKWSQENGVSGDLSTNDKVMKLVEKELAQRGSGFKGYERPRNFAIIAEDFTTENGMLTPTMKLKRRNVLKAYQEKIDALYA